jgi:YesN/AraC family two-component response regulator
MREGIEKNIDWFDLGFQVVDTAAKDTDIELKFIPC